MPTNILRNLFQNVISAIPKNEFATPCQFYSLCYGKAHLIYTYIYTHIHIYMKSSCRKHHLQTWHLHYEFFFFNGVYCIWEKSSSYIHMKSPSTCVRRARFQNMIYKLGIGIANSMFGWTLIAFWNRALCRCLCWYKEYTSIIKPKRSHLTASYVLPSLFCCKF